MEKTPYYFEIDGIILFSKALGPKSTASEIRNIIKNKMLQKNIEHYVFLDKCENSIDKEDEPFYKLENLLIETKAEKIIRLRREKISSSSSENTNLIQNNQKPNQKPNQNIINENKNGKERVVINSNLTEEEILKAKENGFILIGKTGVGKTSLLNIMYKENIGKVGYSSHSETKVSKDYYIKEKIGNENIYFCIIDTPGLYDTEGEEKDNSQKYQLNSLISEKGIKVKGLLFLSNFQNERFDSSEQFSLIHYNSMFPLKDFWHHIIFIFTHYYGDPDGDSKEEIKIRADQLLSNIFKNIMEKVKRVSEPMDFNKIDKKYINIYSRAKNEKQMKNNELIRREIIDQIRKNSKLNAMFNKLYIIHFYNYNIDDKDNNIYDCDLYLFLDINDKIINKNFVKIKAIPKYENYKNDQRISLDTHCCEINENGNLIIKNHKEDSINKVLNTLNKIIDLRKMDTVGKTLSIGSIAGFILTAVGLPFLPISLVGALGANIAFIISNANSKKQKEQENQLNRLNDQNNINELIIEGINNNNNINYDENII